MGDNDPMPAPSSDRGIEDDIKDLIEKCLQLYMNRNEVMMALSKDFNIEPRSTYLVWKRLEEDNPQFFRDYYIRLELIKQINQFNRLLEQQEQYELMLQQSSGNPTPPQSEPTSDIAGGIHQQQLSNATPVQYGYDVLGGMYGDHCASNGTAAVASMGKSVQALSLHSINQSEFSTQASSEQSNCCLPFDPLGMCAQGTNPSPSVIQNQGRSSLLNGLASSGTPDHRGFETEANQLNSEDFLLDSPEHHDNGRIPDKPPKSHPGAQAPGKT